MHSTIDNILVYIYEHSSLSSQVAWSWGPEKQKAFQESKSQLISRLQWCTSTLIES